MEFIPSPRSNKQLVVFEGHIYNRQRNLAGNVILWECINRRNKNAYSARIKTLNGILHGRAPDHRCQPDPEKIQTMKVRGQMKQRAQNTMENTRDILSGAVTGVTGYSPPPPSPGVFAPLGASYAKRIPPPVSVISPPPPF